MLIFAYIGIGVHRDDEVVHLCLEDLLSRNWVFNVSSRGTSLLRVFILIFGAVLLAKVCKTIEILPPRSIFISLRLIFESILSLRNNTERINKKSEILFEVSRTEDSKLKLGSVVILNQSLQLLFPDVHVIL